MKRDGITPQSALMTTAEIKAKVGERVTEAEMVAMLKANPIGTSPNDVRVRSGVLSFSFGPQGVRLEDAEIRTPLATNTSAHGLEN
ncbi:hypothetical protein EJP67_33275 [Variovorax guangxiensis]|uniref:Uncharacterized protein n=1 Tax=Variovorax guangxiensis TaxID=1775474 RepID=A0A3S1A834_9BURK|nr:hypothetical protein [Variovorax guangxiensis]RUR71930.1 hypothetical protein EJP67_33275 [Variovorax guangxiensis]